MLDVIFLNSQRWLKQDKSYAISATSTRLRCSQMVSCSTFFSPNFHLFQHFSWKMRGKICFFDSSIFRDIFSKLEVCFVDCILFLYFLTLWEWESPKKYRVFDETKKYHINKVTFLGNFLRKCPFISHIFTQNLDHEASFSHCRTFPCAGEKCGQNARSVSKGLTDFILVAKCTKHVSKVREMFRKCEKVRQNDGETSPINSLDTKKHLWGVTNRGSRSYCKVMKKHPKSAIITPRGHNFAWKICEMCYF